MKHKVGRLITLLSALGITLLLLAPLAIAQSGGTTNFLPIAMKRYQPQNSVLTICIGQEPATLYAFNGSSFSRQQVLEAIYDGPIDTNSFSSQAIILTRLPSLENGDAEIQSVTVNEGDIVVDANLKVSTLEPGVLIFESGQTEPTSYTGGSVKMDRLEVTFHLKSGLKWSDGTPLTAQDSVYAFNLLKDPDTPANPAFKYSVDRTSSYVVAAEDPLTTTIWTTLPGFKDPTYFVAFFGPAPEHLWGSYSAAELLTAKVSHRKPVGWGPYVIDEWVAGEHISLHKNPYYWRANQGLPKFQYLEYWFVGNDGSANIDALLQGECDILDTTTGLDSQVERLLDLEADGSLQAVFTTGTNWEHVYFGIQNLTYDDGYDGGLADRPNFFGEASTRQAFAMCMDRQAVVDTVTYGQSVVLDTYLSPLHPLFNQEAAHYDFDPAAGSSLLEQAGWIDDDNDSSTPRVASGVSGVPDGAPLIVSLEASNSSNNQQATDLLKQSLAGCGIQAEITLHRLVDWSAPGPDGPLFGRKFDLGLFNRPTGVRPPCGFFMTNQVPGPAGETWVSILDGLDRIFSTRGWAGVNASGFAQDEYDAACLQASNGLIGTAEYEQGQLETQAIFADQLPAVPLYLNVRTAAARPGLPGLSLDPTANSDFWNIETIGIEP